MRCFINIMQKERNCAMNTKLLLTAIISFILGALLVSIAATTFEKDRLLQDSNSTEQHQSGLN